jgi:hypothetical protein
MTVSSEEPGCACGPVLPVSACLEHSTLGRVLHGHTSTTSRAAHGAQHGRPSLPGAIPLASTIRTTRQCTWTTPVEARGGGRIAAVCVTLFEGSHSTCAAHPGFRCAPPGATFRHPLRGFLPATCRVSFARARSAANPTCWALRCATALEQPRRVALNQRNRRGRSKRSLICRHHNHSGRRTESLIQPTIRCGRRTPWFGSKRQDSGLREPAMRSQ